MNWLEYVEDRMGEAEKLFKSGYKPETGELEFLPLCLIARTLARITDMAESIYEKMDTDKMATVKAGGTFKFFGIEDMKDLLKDMKEHKVRGSSDRF